MRLGENPTQCRPQTVLHAFENSKGVLAGKKCMVLMNEQAQPVWNLEMSQANASFAVEEAKRLNGLSKVHQQVSRRIGFRNQ